MMSPENCDGFVKISIMMGNGVLQTFTLNPEKTDLQTFCLNFCQANNLDLNCEKFLQDEIKKYLTFHQKKVNKPLNINQNQEELEESYDEILEKAKRFSFQPTIDKKSNLIITNKKKNDGKAVYDRLYARVIKIIIFKTI